MIDGRARDREPATGRLGVNAAAYHRAGAAAG